MNINFKNNETPIYEYELSLDINGNGTVYGDPTYYEVSFENLETANAGLLWGFRIGGFGAGKLLGGDLEISHYAQQIERQFIILDGIQRELDFNDYLKVNTYLMAGDLLLRFSSRMIQPYIGLGMNVAWRLYLSAITLATYLRVTTLSAVVIASAYWKFISCWPDAHS